MRTPREPKPVFVIVCLRAMRPYQWTKNLLLLAALLFAGELGNLDQVLRGLLAMASFCLAASATYIFNDLRDIENDREHPEKKDRPLASGALSIPVAWVLLTVLFAGSAGLAYYVRPVFVVPLMVYVALTLSYSIILKHLIIIDVMAIASGFVIRAVAGAVALDISFSNWLVVCTFFLATFLGSSKRRHEIALLEDGAHAHRKVLQHYSMAFLDQMILIMACCTILTYTIYTCSPEVVERIGTDKLYLTLPFVVYGLFRYLHLVHHSSDGGDPISTLMKDRSLGLTVLLWAIACVVIIYVPFSN